MENFASYVGPVLSFAGTVVVVAFGYYQWRKQHGNPNRAAVSEEKRKASEALWHKLEELNLRLRANSPVETIKLSPLLQEINTLFIANSLYLKDDQQTLINEYVKSMHRVSELVGISEDEIKSKWQATVIMPLEPSSPELRTAFAELSRLRSIVKETLFRTASG